VEKDAAEYPSVAIGDSFRILDKEEIIFSDKTGGGTHPFHGIRKLNLVSVDGTELSYQDLDTLLKNITGPDYLKSLHDLILSNDKAYLAGMGMVATPSGGTVTKIPTMAVFIKSQPNSQGCRKFGLILIRLEDYRKGMKGGKQGGVIHGTEN
jgi:hypothetical protein